MHPAKRTAPRARGRLVILLGATLAAGGGCVGFPDDIERVERDVARVRQEMAVAARNNESARAMYEERLRRLEGSRRELPAPQAAASSPGVQAELDQRLHELLGEYRMLQGKLEENAAALERLQQRVDALERARR